MRFIPVLLALPFLMAANCGQYTNKTVSSGGQKEITEEVKDSVPVCIKRMIGKGNKETPPNAPLQVDEYLYEGKKVFLTTAPCCDQFNMLYDSNCQAICAPTGGFTGRGDGKCPDFSKKAKFIKLIWKNSAN